VISSCSGDRKAVNSVYYCSGREVSLNRLYRNTPRLHVLKFSFSFTRARWDLLHSAAIARQSSLEESLLSLGQFEEAYDELWAWLTDALRQLGDMEPITGDPDAVAAQLSKHKVTVMLTLA